MPEMSGWDVARELKKINPKVLIGLILAGPLIWRPKNYKTAALTGSLPSSSIYRRCSA